MKNLYLILLFTLLFGSICHAQTSSRNVLSTLGASYSDSNFSATYTVGETIISTLSNGGIVATQGFQQPSCQTDSSSFADSGISSYLWNGNIYTISGSYQHIYINSLGCDSIVTLNLTIYNTSVSMTLQNMIQISPTAFEYDVMLQNTGNTVLALKGYSCGLNHESGMRNGGTLTHTFLSRDAALSTIPNVVPGYTASTNHLRLFTFDAGAGNEFNLLPGNSIRIATMRVSNSVPFPNNFLPNITLQTITDIGKTPCVATCIATPPGINYTINGIANTPSAGTLQALTGIVNTPCLYLNAVTPFSASGIESTIATCYGSGSGSAIITLTGVGVTSFPGTYSIDGGASIAYASNPFTINNLSAGSHTVQVVNSNACVSNFSLSISQPFFTPSIQQNDTTICLGNSISLQAVSSGASNSSLPSNLQNGLVAWYPFNGNANDASGNNLDGIVTSALLTSDRNGIGNSAYSFNGSAMIQTLFPTAHAPSSSNFYSSSMWFSKSSNSEGLIFQYMAGQTINVSNYDIFSSHSLCSNGTISVQNYPFNNPSTCSPIAINIGDWTNIYIVFNHIAQTFETYKNGQFWFNGSLGNIPPYSGYLTFGNAMGGGFGFQGKLDDIGIWNRALSASEIQQLYNNDSTSYLWSTGDTTATINVSPTQTTTYYLTTANGSNVCVDSVVVTVNQPTINAGNAQSICYGDSMILSASGATTYQWSNSVIDAQVFFPVNTNNYTVVGTNSLGCTASAQVMVTVNANAIPIITPTGSTTFCEGESVNLQANTGLGISYAWYKDDAMISGATSNVLTVNQSGTYKVKTTNSNTCSAYSLPQVVSVNNCNVDLHLKLFYQGYYIGMNSMTPVLQNQGVLVDSLIVDTVSIELHHPLPPYGLAITKQAILHTDGSLTCNFPYFNGSYYLIDSYYVAIKHRNGLTTWSAHPITFSSPSITYDFTNSSSQAYGDNMIEMESGVWAFYVGELNYDGNIDLLDYPIVQLDIFNFVSGYAATDLTGDGNVDLLEEPIISNNIFNFIYSILPSWSGTLPSVSTNAITTIAVSNAISGGSILQDGGSPITARGICWSVNPNPTITDNHTDDGMGVGIFTSILTNLNPSTSYYVRAYASNANGTVYGNEVVFTSAALAIGDNYGGGKVAYILQPGDPGYIVGEVHGLIAAESDLGTAEWGCWGTSIFGTQYLTSNNFGRGNLNTIEIVASCNTSGIAAKICSDLQLNGYADWYLPSKDELNFLYINRIVINGFTSNYYWSSSELPSCCAWRQDFNTGLHSGNSKFAYNYVRAIRSF